MTRTIGCRDAIERLWDYLDGGLNADRHDELEAHLTWCVQCCGELEFAKHLRGILRERSTPRMPIDVAARLHRVVDELPATEAPISDRSPYPDGRPPPPGPTTL
jgi:anti-sigma factor (TIGR02949 family)